MADHIAARIEDGELPPGTQLPHERALAVEDGVSIDTSRRAAAAE
jgi:GntR family transcriptional regulator